MWQALETVAELLANLPFSTYIPARVCIVSRRMAKKMLRYLILGQNDP